MPCPPPAGASPKSLTVDTSFELLYFRLPVHDLLLQLRVLALQLLDLTDERYVGDAVGQLELVSRVRRQDLVERESERSRGKRLERCSGVMRKEKNTNCSS